MTPYTPPAVPTTIPIIDLEGGFSPDPADLHKVAWEIHKACRETGFFYIANHRVPAALVAQQFDSARRFFALPLEQKLALHMKHSASAAGYEPIGGQWLDSQDQSAEVAPPDLKESFYACTELADDHPLVRQRMRGYGHNQWPSALPDFAPQQLAYAAAVRALGDRLLGLIALSLELPESFFVEYYDLPVTTLRLIKYPPHPPMARENQLGAGAHTDWGGVTLLAQDDLGGLEVKNAADQWIQATPVTGTFVVNLGDLMQRWTNGIYRSNMHRVKNNNALGRDRYSIPYFYSPRHDAQIRCMPTCTNATNPPRYEAVSARAHMDEMFRLSYGYAPGQAP
ncbi:MAG: 2-oxoglutarate and iron-dependent oxygenase domain-containing protein [Burkholderiales bacterium]